MSNHAVIDLETLGLTARAAIASVGLAIIKNGVVTESMHWACDWQKQNRMVTPSTKEWWEARPTHVYDRELGGKLPLAYVLGMVAGTVMRYKVAGVWGNGAAFDNAILHDAAEQAGFPRLWSYKADMCLRTMRALAPDVELPFEGDEHNAEDDAVHQAKLLIAIYKKLGLKL